MARIFCIAAAILAMATGCATSGRAVIAKEIHGSVRTGWNEVYRVDRFRVGWYDSAKNLETPERLAKSGFDSVMPYSSNCTIQEVLAFLAASHQAGIAVHLEIPRARVTDPTGVSLEEYIRATSGSQAVLGWYLFDEPELKYEARPKLLKAAYFRVKTLDPARKVAIVFVLPNLSGAYRDSMDSLWIDYYPVTRRSREFASLRCGRYADRMKAYGRWADRYQLPLTLVLQGFGESKDGKPQFWHRLPTPAETLYMFWASLLARPVEIMYWTLYRCHEDWFQKALSPVIGKFRKMFPDTVEYWPSEGFALSGGRADFVLLGNGQGQLWLLLLNREGKERNLVIEAPYPYVFRNGTAAGSDKTRCATGPYGVLLLEISKIR